MPIQVGARDARDKLSDLMGRVYYSGETVIVNRSGKPMVAMISVELYERLVAEREARFEVLERIRRQLPDVSEEEAARDVAEAIAAARRHPNEPA